MRLSQSAMPGDMSLQSNFLLGLIIAKGAGEGSLITVSPDMPQHVTGVTGGVGTIGALLEGALESGSAQGIGW